VLQCVAVCFIVLQRVAACCNMLFSGKLAEMTSQGRRVEVCCRVFNFFAACCSMLQFDIYWRKMTFMILATSCGVLQCVEVYCIVLQRVVACCSVMFVGILAEDDLHDQGDELQCVAVCCSVLQCVAVRCMVLQCVAICCSLSQYDVLPRYLRHSV